MLTCNLKKLIAKNKIETLTELIILSGITNSSINKLYKESDIITVQLGTLLKLCDTFNCKLSDLIEYTPDDRV